MDRCGDCEFNRFGTCHGLPPKDEFLAHGCRHLSIRPRVGDCDHACALFRRRGEEKREKPWSA